MTEEVVTVLIIDDDATTSKVLESALTGEGFRVFCALKGHDGLDIAKAEHIDVVLLDWMMPEMDGIEVLSELKRNADTMHIPVFMLTSREDARDIEFALSRGVVDYIVKPFNIFYVPDLVKTYLERVPRGKRSKKGGLLRKIFAH